MQTLRIIDGRVVSGHFIFVRDAGSLDDNALLSAVGRSGYTQDWPQPPHCRFVHILRDGDWSGIADDWYYTLYNDSGIGRRVEDLAGQFELLRTVVGDADDSCEFYHYVGGILRREFDFRDWRPQPPRVFKDVGPRFQCESDYAPGTPPDGFIRLLHDELGIDHQLMADSVRTYTAPYSP